MRKKIKILNALWLLAILVLSGCNQEKGKLAKTTQVKRPNILFIPVDDLRPDLGCYGNSIVKTPNIDKLASNGVVFNRAYCQQAVCTPSRTSLLTGLRPDSTQVWDLKKHFRDVLPDIVSLPQFFKNNGYHTVGLGKTFHNTLQDSVAWNEYLHVDGFPFDPDAVYINQENLIIQKEQELNRVKKGTAKFDKYGFIYTKANSIEMAEVNDDDYYDGAQTTMALKKMRELGESDEPFFLSVGFYKPHLPFTAPKKYWDMYNSEDIPLATNRFTPKDSPIFSMHGDAELRGYSERHDLPKPNEASLSEAEQRELIHAYYACISYVDVQIGRLMDELERSGLMENTIVVLWGDHGWKLGEHNGWGKQTNYEIDTRVPLIISGNNVNGKGKTSKALTELVDIYPTLCDVTGFEVPKHLHGTSLKPLLENPEASVKDAAYSQFLLGRYGPKALRGIERMGYTVRTGQYRYVEWYEWKPESKTRGDFITSELFDHEIDAQENINIANNSENKVVIAQMAKVLNKGFNN